MNASITITIVIILPRKYRHLLPFNLTLRDCYFVILGQRVVIGLNCNRIYVVWYLILGIRIVLVMNFY